MRWRVVMAAWTATCVAACDGGGDPPATSDAGVDAALGVPVDIPWLAAGAPPVAPPALTPCPAGWREVPPDIVDGAATCDPFPEGGARACPAGQAHFPGEPDCASIGGACPAGDWPEGLPASGVVHVRAGAAAGGDGSLALPYATIADGMRVATPGTTVAIAKGRYVEVVVLAPDVTVVGACASETSIAPTTVGVSRGAVRAGRIGVARLRNLGIVDSPRVGLCALGDGVEIDADGIEITSAGEFGLAALNGGRLVVRNVVVRATRATFGRTAGEGLYVDAGSTADVGRAVLENNLTVGAVALGAGASITLADVVVRDTESQPLDVTLGNGLRTEGGASAEATRSLFERSREVGVFAIGAGSSIRLTDVVVRDTRSREADTSNGSGLGLYDGASVEASRTLLDRNHENGAFAVGTESVLRLADVVVRDTESTEGDGFSGNGLVASDGALVEVARARFERNRSTAVTAEGAGSIVRLEDVVVSDTLGRRAEGYGGRGLGIGPGGLLEASRCIVERSRELGVFADGVGSMVRLVDVLVRDTESEDGDGIAGRGMSAQRGAVADAQRVVLERSREAGIYAIGADTVVSLANVVVRDIRLPACAETTCPSTAVATSIGSYLTATITARGFLAERSVLCGVQVATDGALDLRDGLVREHTVGACIQVDGYDFARLTTDVRYVDNDTNLQTTMLPVPDPTPPL